MDTSKGFEMPMDDGANSYRNNTYGYNDVDDYTNVRDAVSGERDIAIIDNTDKAQTSLPLDKNVTSLYTSTTTTGTTSTISTKDETTLLPDDHKNIQPDSNDKRPQRSRLAAPSRQRGSLQRGDSIWGILSRSTPGTTDDGKDGNDTDETTSVATSVTATPSIFTSFYNALTEEVNAEEEQKKNAKIIANMRAEMNVKPSSFRKRVVGEDRSEFWGYSSDDKEDIEEDDDAKRAARRIKMSALKSNKKTDNGNQNDSFRLSDDSMRELSSPLMDPEDDDEDNDEVVLNELKYARRKRSLVSSEVKVPDEKMVRQEPTVCDNSSGVKEEMSAKTEGKKPITTTATTKSQLNDNNNDNKTPRTVDMSIDDNQSDENDEKEDERKKLIDKSTQLNDINNNDDKTPKTVNTSIDDNQSDENDEEDERERLIDKSTQLNNSNDDDKTLKTVSMSIDDNQNDENDEEEDERKKLIDTSTDNIQSHSKQTSDYKQKEFNDMSQHTMPNSSTHSHISEFEDNITNDKRNKTNDMSQHSLQNESSHSQQSNSEDSPEVKRNSMNDMSAHDMKSLGSICSWGGSKNDGSNSLTSSQEKKPKRPDPPPRLVSFGQYGSANSISLHAKGFTSDEAPGAELTDSESLLHLPSRTNRFEKANICSMSHCYRHWKVLLALLAVVLGGSIGYLSYYFVAVNAPPPDEGQIPILMVPSNQPSFSSVPSLSPTYIPTSTININDFLTISPSVHNSSLASELLTPRVPNRKRKKSKPPT